MQNEPSQRALTIAELAHKYQLDQSTIWRHVKKGTLQLTRIGRAARITPDQETQWIEAIQPRDRA